MGCGGDSETENKHVLNIDEIDSSLDQICGRFQDLSTLVIFIRYHVTGSLIQAQASKAWGKW